MICSKITVPPVGVDVKSCKLTRWHVSDSGWVQKGDLIATLETRKVACDLEAEHEGTLRHIASEGDRVEIHALIGTIEYDGFDLVGEAPRLTTEITSDDLTLLDKVRGSESRDEFLLNSLRNRLAEHAGGQPATRHESK